MRLCAKASLAVSDQLNSASECSDYRKVTETFLSSPHSRYHPNPGMGFRNGESYYNTGNVDPQLLRRITDASFWELIHRHCVPAHPNR